MQSKAPAAVLVVAILAVAGLVAFALSRGHDGSLLAFGIAVIAALGGVKIGELLAKR